MTELQLVIYVIFFFFVRIGIPLILLVILGTVIDRWQRKLHNESDQYRNDQLHGLHS
jgi:uncharacterized membrane protein